LAYRSQTARFGFLGHPDQQHTPVHFLGFAPSALKCFGASNLPLLPAQPPALAALLLAPRARSCVGTRGSRPRWGAWAVHGACVRRPPHANPGGPAGGRRGLASPRTAQLHDAQAGAACWRAQPSCSCASKSPRAAPCLAPPQSDVWWRRISFLG
jgi:hypothetical protein